ncbi:arginine-specific demethylase JMJ20 isoform X2 [Magnolia sinica]|uniref:arginine-specific demethylase JMJ20 isoform X2 n=1 Tax=Magnolia sinica TaxID=86752 RepID=UPI00265A389D|nr:arginine-specific demethylase JMJ20 isoform X2 [Magnolia sinica]
MGLNIGGKVERINGRELRYHEFVDRYLQKNQPIVITGLMNGWMASNDWTTENGAPNLSFFSTHFGKSKVQEYPEYAAYTTPLFFVDDWLNLYLDSHPMHMDGDVCHDKNEINCSDYRFVYMGPKGTWTPLHADVFRSYSWSANVCGKKKWHLLPPSQCHLLFDQNMKSTVYDIFGEVSEAQFPGFKKTVWLECTQEQNEIIFVPSGWYHQVLNLEDTISINHNWFNAFNLSWVWNLLLKDYNEAKEYIEDIRDICDDFEGLCQRNLAANTGMNFFDFFIFITRFSFANLSLLYHHVKTDENPIWVSPNRAHNLISNLISIHKVATKMKSVEAFAGVKQSAISDIRKILQEPEFIELCMALNRTYGSIDEQQKQCSGTNNTSLLARADFLHLGFVESIGFEVAGPEDLIRIIEQAATNLSCMGSDWNLSLSYELNDLESPTVL